MSDHDPRLDALLARLPEGVPFPPTPDIASRIGEALPDRRPARLHRPSPWLVGAAIAAVVLLLVVALPGPRSAVADFLGLPGIRIELTDRPSTGQPPTSTGSSLLFGDRTTLDEARERAPFPVALPATANLRDPDEVWVRETDDVTSVSLLYAARDGLPEIGDTGVGLLLMQFRTVDEVPYLAKRVMGEGLFSVVTVNGRDAYWIEGGELVVLPAGLEDTQGMSRPSGNVLLWEQSGVTYRMESSLDRATAIDIAESLQPVARQESGNQSARMVVWEITTRYTSSRRSRHESPSLPCHNPCHPLRPPRQIRHRRWLGIDPVGRRDARRLRR